MFAISIYTSAAADNNEIKQPVYRTSSPIANDRDFQKPLYFFFAAAAAADRVFGVHWVS